MPHTKAQEGAIARRKFLKRKRERERERCQATINAQLEQELERACWGITPEQRRRCREQTALEGAKLVMKALSDGKVDLAQKLVGLFIA